jgi:type II secretory ATPase GspE/PulE/Tfp pilus assembly ATPase PilB-like protein
MANMDIGERRKPQDGRFEITVAGRNLDVRTSILPLNRGEKVVMRLLDKSKIKVNLHDLGFDQEQHKVFTDHLARPHEIILVTGPTGSGKTTTLYAALNQINEVGRNIVTVEDPVEYELRGVNQVQINPRADLTFVTALRSILRQDPDVVMIGEIRDVETAEIAMQAALTGHLVLSTLHTNDAAGAIARLIDMGIAPFLIASSVGLVVAQRLVRRLCPHCKQRFVPPEEVQRDLGLDYVADRSFFRAVGCSQCENSGYQGRIAIYEILPVSDAIEAMIMERASSRSLFRQAQNEGLVSLRDAGLSKVQAGLTSLEELMRVTMADKE